MHAHTPEEDIRPPVLVFFTLSLQDLRQDLSLSLELGWQPASPGDHAVSDPHGAGLTGLCADTFVCYAGAGIRAQILMLEQQALLPTEHSPLPAVRL